MVDGSTVNLGLWDTAGKVPDLSELFVHIFLKYFACSLGKKCIVLKDKSTVILLLILFEDSQY